MDKNIRDALERAFSTDLVRTRKGSFGKDLSYVEVAHYIRRLNEAFGGDWSFEIVEHRLLDAEAVVLGKLTAGGITKTAFGGSVITVTRESGKPVSLSDDLKAAASDSLKKACSLLGIGLEMYVDAEPQVKDEPPARPAAVPQSPQPGSNQLTQRQYRAILGLSAQAGISEIDLGKWVQNSYGVSVDELDRREASDVITKLNQSNNGGNGKAAGGTA